MSTSDQSTEPAAQVVRVSTAAEMGTAGRVRVGLRSYYSTHFLAAAQDAADEAADLEAELLGQHDRRFSLRHRGLVLTAVIESVAFLEAVINEVLQDATDGHITEKLEGVDSEVRRSWAGIWEALGQGETGRNLERYQAALIAAGVEPFDKGAEPWQSAQLLVQLRNHLVHYKPATVYSDEPEKLVTRLEHKLDPNPLSTNTGQVDGWLSAECARWAVDSAVALVGAFADRTGARPNYMTTLDNLRRDNA